MLSTSTILTDSRSANRTTWIYTTVCRVICRCLFISLPCLSLGHSSLSSLLVRSFFFFFNDTATTEIYTLSLHDALPILQRHGLTCWESFFTIGARRRAMSSMIWLARPKSWQINCRKITLSLHRCCGTPTARDRKSTRLNSSHGYISYAVFCLKKKKSLQV